MTTTPATQPGEPRPVPQNRIDLNGLTPDLGDPTSGIQYAVLDAGEYHTYGDQSWVADGRALAESHPDGRIVSRTITSVRTHPGRHLAGRTTDGPGLSPRHSGVVWA